MSSADVRRRVRAAAALLVLLSLPHFTGCALRFQRPAVTAAALWRPSPAVLAAMHDRCARGAALVADCLASEMRAAGASPEAIAFAQRLPIAGFMQAFWGAEPVAVAGIRYPFRANENAAWLLVNGAPSLIDVDDYRLAPIAEIRADGTFGAIARAHPAVSLWPGDRSGANPPAIERRPDGGERITVVDRLRDGCHACAILGEVRYAFAFDDAGRFIGTHLVSITPQD